MPATLTVDFPGRYQNRTVIQGLLSVPSDGAGRASLGGANTFNLVLNGEVLQDGKLFDIGLFGFYRARKYTCWNMAHTCDPAMVAQYAAEKLAAIASGEVVKGATVVVVRGRKVPKGTTGIVFWTGTDAYDKPKIGFRDAAGATHWTATSNVEVKA